MLREEPSLGSTKNQINQEPIDSNGHVEPTDEAPPPRSSGDFHIELAAPASRKAYA
jgi:hypothetical protein